MKGMEARKRHAQLLSDPPMDSRGLPLVEPTTTRDIPAARDRHAPGDIVLAAGFASGEGKGAHIGMKLGFLYRSTTTRDSVTTGIGVGGRARFPIVSCGFVQFGTQRYVLGVVENTRTIFLGTAWPRPRLWAHVGARLETPALDLRAMSRGDGLPQARAYAESLARYVVDACAPKGAQRAMAEALRQYSAALQALAQEQTLNAAAIGFPRTVADFARNIDPTWKARDMLHPKCVDLRHAIYVGIALDLPASRASGLLRLAALIEYGVPLLTSDLAFKLFTHVRSIAVNLHAPYFHEGVLTDWTIVGGIAKLFNRQFIRIVQETMAGREEPTASEAEGEAESAESEAEGEE